MPVTQKQKTAWRAAAVVLLAIASLGPWMYDLIHVPAEYLCEGPYVRLQGDFCGLPFSLITGISTTLSSLALTAGAVGEEVTIGRWLTAGLLYLLYLLLFTIPIWVTLALVLRQGSRRLQTLHLIVCAVAALGGGLTVTAQAIWRYAAPWGVLLYTSILLILVILELLARYWDFRPEPVARLETG